MSESKQSLNDCKRAFEKKYFSSPLTESEWQLILEGEGPHHYQYFEDGYSMVNISSKSANNISLIDMFEALRTDDHWRNAGIDACIGVVCIRGDTSARKDEEEARNGPSKISGDQPVLNRPISSTSTLIQQPAFEAFMTAYHEHGGTGLGFRKCLREYEAAKSSEIPVVNDEWLEGFCHELFPQALEYPGEGIEDVVQRLMKALRPYVYAPKRESDCAEAVIIEDRP